MGRAPCCDKANVKRGPWSPEEDATLKRYVEAHGTGGNWISLPQKAGLKRCGKSCRLRWLNYLRPDIKHGGFTEEEDNIIFTLYSQMGSRWSLIASQLPGRTDNDVKNYWNTKLKKKLLAGKTSLGTSKTNTDIPSNNLSQFVSSTLLPCTVPNIEPYNLNYLASQSHLCSSLPMLTDAAYALTTFGTTHRFSADTAQFSCSQAAHDYYLPEFGASMKTGHMGSETQEGSSVSDSNSLIAVDHKSVSLAGGDGEDAGVLMDFGSGFPYDLMISSTEAAPSCYSSLDDIYANVNPRGLNQSLTNQY